LNARIFENASRRETVVSMTLCNPIHAFVAVAASFIYASLKKVDFRRTSLLETLLIPMVTSLLYFPFQCICAGCLPHDKPFLESACPQ